MDPIHRQLPPHLGGVTALTLAAWCAVAHAVVRRNASESAATSLDQDQWALQRCQVTPLLVVLVGVHHIFFSSSFFLTSSGRGAALAIADSKGM